MNTILAAHLISTELKGREIKNNYSTSDTDYGTSCYFTFYKSSESLDKLKVRVSDHSVTNVDRMNDEMLVNASNFDVNRVVDAIEFYLHPERFALVPATTIEKGNAYYMISGKLQQRIKL